MATNVRGYFEIGEARRQGSANFKEVILVISSGRYKSLEVFIEFEKNKNYDAVEITRY
jgi:hypothetical protein